VPQPPFHPIARLLKLDPHRPPEYTAYSTILSRNSGQLQILISRDSEGFCLRLFASRRAEKERWKHYIYPWNSNLYSNHAIFRIRNSLTLKTKESAFMYLSKVTLAASATATTRPSLAPVPYHQVQQTQWGPGVISNIIFGCIMVVIGALALWHGHFTFSRTLNRSLMPLARKALDCIKIYLKTIEGTHLGYP